MLATAITICSIIGLWKIFEAIGIEGWWAIIPFANIYKQISFFWGKGKAIAAVVFAAIGTLILFISLFLFAGAASSDSGFWAVIGVLVFMLSFLPILVAGIIGCVANYKMGQYFGKSTAFCVGLILLNPIFMIILGFSKDLGAQAAAAASVPAASPAGNAAQADASEEPQGAAPYIPQNTYTNPYESAPAESSFQDQAQAAGNTQDGWAPSEDEPRSPRRCPSCGAQVADDASFCTVCGQRLG